MVTHAEVLETIEAIEALAQIPEEEVKAWADSLDPETRARLANKAARASMVIAVIAEEWERMERAREQRGAPPA